MQKAVKVLVVDVPRFQVYKMDMLKFPNRQKTFE